ncbi:MAG TPA: hypothetical protein PLS12_11235, partial [Bacteroidales bacterium]|nr:hypothetical protein [Bacteroidales bacterium]
MKLHAQYKMSNKKYMVTLSLIKFKEDKAAIIYSPALDLSGYGNTFEDAKKSFSTTLQEFIKYTHNKRT